MAFAYDVPAAEFAKALRKCLLYVGQQHSWIEVKNLWLKTDGTHLHVLAMDGCRAIDYQLPFLLREGEELLSTLMPPPIARAILAILGPKVADTARLTLVDVDYLHGGDVAVELPFSTLTYQRIAIEHPNWDYESLLSPETEEVATRVNGKWLAQMMQGAPDKAGVAIKRRVSSGSPRAQPLILEWGNGQDEPRVRQIVMPIMREGDKNHG